MLSLTHGKLTSLKMKQVEDCLNNFTIKKLKYILNYPYFFDLFCVYVREVKEGRFASEFRDSEALMHLKNNMSKYAYNYKAI